MRTKGIAATCAMLVFCFLAPLTFAETPSPAPNTQELITQQDVIQQIIQLVVKNSPTLCQQRDLIAEIEKMPQPGEGFVDPEVIKGVAGVAVEEAPLLTLDQVENIRGQMITRITTLGAEKRTYQDLQKELLSELMSKITRILTLKNRKKNLSELKSFLEERKISLEKQVKVGVEESSVLFDLIERIINASLNIQNTDAELKMLKLEIAANFAGVKQKEFLVLLDEI